jgi:hypothetical protein
MGSPSLVENAFPTSMEHIAIRIILTNLMPHIY